MVHMMVQVCGTVVDRRDSTFGHFLEAEAADPSLGIYLLEFTDHFGPKNEGATNSPSCLDPRWDVEGLLGGVEGIAVLGA